MKEMVWVVLLALLCCTGLLACRSESAKSALPPLKELTEPWTSLGVVYPVDGAYIDHTSKFMFTAHYPTVSRDDTRIVHAAMIEAFRVAGWKEVRTKQYNPTYFSATYSKEDWIVVVDTEWHYKNGKGLVACKVFDHTVKGD